MITYRHDGLSPFKITVKLEGKIAGRILRTADGRYYYKPKSGASGDEFCTLQGVKNSLECVE